MRPALRTASLALFSLVALFLVWFGVVYLRAESMLWFHAAAIPERARADALPLYRALMNLIGGSSAGAGVLSLYLTWGPLRRGAFLADGVLLVVLVGVFTIAAVTAETLHAETCAPTSWHIMGVLIAASVAAFGASIAARARPAASGDASSFSPRPHSL